MPTKQKQKINKKQTRKQKQLKKERKKIPKVEKLPRPGRKMLRKKPNKLGEWREAVAK